MVQDKQGHTVEYVDYWDEDGDSIYHQYYCPIEERNVIITEHKKQEEINDLDPSMTVLCNRKEHEPCQNNRSHGDCACPCHSEKQEEATQVQAYQLTQEEFDNITNEAWAGEGCAECQSILQSVEMDDGKYAIYPTPAQAEHMQGIFGYQTDPSMSPAGYLDPDDPNWQRSVEHISERQKEFQQDPEKGRGFGPQSGMMRGEPTRDEWQVTSYLDELGVQYVHKMKLGELDPEVDKPKVEFDIYIPEYLIAIETSPNWHEGGDPNKAKTFPQVIENDRYKAKFAKEHGIDLISFDPAKGTEKFINEELVPRLRSVGVDAFEVHQAKEKQETKDYGSTSKNRVCPKCGSNDTYAMNIAETIFRCNKCREGFESEEDVERFLKSESPDPNQALIDKYQVEKFGPIKIADLPYGFLAQCEDHGTKFSSRDYDEVADWTIDHLAHLHPDDMYSPSMNPIGDFERGPIGLNIDEVAELREEDVAAPIVGESGDFYTHKPLDNIDTETGEESPMQTDYGYSHKFEDICPNCKKPLVTYQDHGETKCGHCSYSFGYKKKEGHYPNEGGKGQGFEKGNPFNQQYIYREVQAGYDWDYNVKYREKPILEEQDDSQNYPLHPNRGNVNTIEQKTGGPDLHADNNLKLEEEEDSWFYDYLKDEGDGVFVCKICDWAWIKPTYGELNNHFEGLHADELEKPSEWEKLFDPFTLGEQEQSGYREALIQLADEASDDIVRSIEEGSISKVEGDELLAMQTKVKELTMDGHREQALTVLFQMADKLATLIQSRDNPEGQ